jgi:hypothetical protein
MKPAERLKRSRGGHKAAHTIKKRKLVSAEGEAHPGRLFQGEHRR